MNKQEDIANEVSSWVLALLRAAALILIPTIIIIVVTVLFFNPDYRDVDVWAPWIMLLGSATGIIATILKQGEHALQQKKEQEDNE